MKKLIALAVILVGVIGYGCWHFSDKRVVPRKAHEFVDLFEKEAGDGLLTGMSDESSFRDLLDKRVSLDFERRDMPDMPDGIQLDRDKLASNYLYLMKSAKLIKLTEKKVTLDSIEDDIAKVTVQLQGEIEHSKYSLNSEMTVFLTFKKTDEGWRISVIKVKK